MSRGWIDESLATFARGAVWTDPAMQAELARKLAKTSRERGGLRLKFGMDPSSADLHVGHAVVLLKLRDLQRLGHTIVLIVGDATAMVGDPSGRNKLRPQLSRAEVEANLVTYTEQAGILLDMGKTEVRKNSEWFDAMRFEDVLRLLGRRTVAQTLAREDFQKRLTENAAIGLHELVYPVMQGWDSVQVRADVEFGGTDQLFNLLVGRDLQEQAGQAPQVVVMSPLINGLDGRKMSKSYGNTIGLTDAPQDVFGKTMSIVDEAMPVWFELLTRLAQDERAKLIAGHPREAKARLAWELVKLLHGESAASRAREGFDLQFAKKELPADIPVLDWPLLSDGTPSGETVPSTMPLTVLLKGLRLTSSSSEAHRLIEQGGVRIDNRVISDPKAMVSPSPEGLLIQVGKRRFARVRPPPR